MACEEKSQLLVDEEGGLRRLGGDREIYNELMDMFIQNAMDQIALLKEAVEMQNADTIEKVAHSIKGAAANLGVLLVQQSAYELEKIGNKKELVNAPLTLNSLILEFERVKQYWRS